MIRTARWVEKHGVKPGVMFTDGPPYGRHAGQRHLLVMDARRNGSKHIVLVLDGGGGILVDGNWPVVQESTRGRRA